MNGKRILVVDDEPGLREIVRVNLEWEGYQVMEAQDGQEALEMARETPPDLVILDVMMPRLNGWQALQAIESAPDLAGTPVIMLTVIDDEAAMIQGLEMGAIEYICKPFSPLELVHKVHTLLEELDARGRDAHRRQVIQKRKQFMKPLDQLFEGRENEAEEGG